MKSILDLDIIGSQEALEEYLKRKGLWDPVPDEDKLKMIGLSREYISGNLDHIEGLKELLSKHGFDTKDAGTVCSLIACTIEDDGTIPWPKIVWPKPDTEAGPKPDFPSWWIPFLASQSSSWKGLLIANNNARGMGPEKENPKERGG